MITLNEMKTLYWIYADKILLWFNGLPEVYFWAICISLAIIGSFLLYKVTKRAYKYYLKKKRSKVPNQTIGTQKNMERESQIECSNNADSKIINNVYNM